MGYDTAEIRRLNDNLRRNPKSGVVVITPGVAALGKDTVAHLFKVISTYDNFCRDNDPYNEHDFGALEIDGTMIFFKIDYYDKQLNGHSSDPANSEVTERVITIMLAAEY